MDSRNPWTLLGIAPTDDARAIRVAYTARLKEIDPEADPQSFIALRAAYEAATNGAPEAVIEASPSPIRPDQWEQPEREAAPQERPAPDPATEHARAIEALLYRNHGAQPWMSEADQAALIDHWRAIAADPRMDILDYRAGVEQWARVMIAETSPISAPILMLAAEAFGWQNADTRAHRDPYEAEIARRYRMLQLIHAASKPDTLYHAAWVELNTPADPFSTPGKVKAARVFTLLAAAQYALPQLLETFDQLRVSTWQEYAAAGYVPPQSFREAFFGSGFGILALYAFVTFGLGAVAVLYQTVASWFE